jgi:C-5 cytosine-specific DNA methylase
MSDKPIVYDLYSGLGGWSEAFLAEGYRCVGFDLEAHDYGTGGYPGELILRDVRSIHGSELKDATCIVGSSPCQEFSYRAMPWKRAKALPPPYLGMELFHAQFRIQREASEAAGRHIPMVVENVRGAQKWVGRARWNYGSFYLWGDVPALMPNISRCVKIGTAGDFNMDWSNYGKPGYKGKSFSDEAVRRMKESTGFRFDGSARSFQTASVKAAAKDDAAGTKMDGDWFSDPTSTCRRHGSKSKARKAASAMIAKIPYPLALHIARSLPLAGGDGARL